MIGLAAMERALRALRVLGVLVRTPEQRRLDAALAQRRAERERLKATPPGEMQIAARKGAATKRRQRLERDPLMQPRRRAS